MPSVSSEFFWINFILVSPPYVVAKMAIINSILSSLSYLVVHEKRKKVHLSKFSCKIVRDHPFWPRLNHTPMINLITVASEMKYFEFSVHSWVTHPSLVPKFVLLHGYLKVCVSMGMVLPEKMLSKKKVDMPSNRATN